MDFKGKFDLRKSSLSNLEPERILEVAAQLSASPLRHSAELSGGFSNTNILRICRRGTLRPPSFPSAGTIGHGGGSIGLHVA